MDSEVCTWYYLVLYVRMWKGLLATVQLHAKFPDEDTLIFMDIPIFMAYKLWGVHMHVCCISACVCTCQCFQRLHTYAPLQAALMDLVPGDKAKGLKTPVWDEYRKIIKEAEGKEVCIVCM